MAIGVYVAASDARSNKGAVALGLIELLFRQVGTVGVYRPVVRAGVEDGLINTARSRFRMELSYEQCAGVTYEDVHADLDQAIADIVAGYREVAARCAAVVVIGTDYTDVGAPTEFEFNAQVAANLGTPVLNVVTGLARTVDEIVAAAEVSAKELAEEHAVQIALVVSRVAPALVERVRTALPDSAYVLPEVPRLSAPTVADLLAACHGRLYLGDEQQLGREVGALMVCAMSLPNILDRLTEGVALIVPADRAAALLPGLIAAHRTPTFPALSAIIMNGGMPLPDSVERLLTGMDIHLPMITTPGDTFETATRLSRAEGRFTPDASGKIDSALGLFAEHVDGPALLARLHVTPATVVTPLMFEYDLLERARADRRHIVLPEGAEPRILRAADILLRRGVADLTLLGEETEIRATAAQLGLAVEDAKVLSPFDPELRERFAAEYAKIRAHKGITLERAWDTVTDVSYFGTMMVHLGLADGMVSGAVHTTAHTIRPSFEIIKTLGAGVVSSVFFMCLADRVLVYGDCAVVPDPTAVQLADIAISSAATAARFGVEPRVALLSYSTGESGAGPEVEKVRAATAMVRERRPDLLVEGPIQYDAAAEPSVARTKMPDSPVAGRATVFVVPDLNTGNNLYKAVQRSAGAVAVGPVLQGLRKPVNDLSRGATVHDIVNTVAITAIQAQGD
ncbi:phosphate acetyltransferase [Acrocarpospora catenulata]|uniref:phosphate acetyltransferase n=1 Tax=Acrocarpospora catenulata TaxID=2836182 RepID=UPI001BDA431E|nr:phosphate acetyltransferase [Acrocarpospora catenulata]